MTPQTDKKVRAVGFQMLRHAGHGGYSQILRYLDGTVQLIDKSPRFSSYIPLTIKNMLKARSGLVWYFPGRLDQEIGVICDMLKSRGRVYHFIYGENSYCYSGGFSRSRGHRMICTYHLPPSVFGSFVKRQDHLKRLDAVVAVASNQKEFFAEKIGGDRVFIVPHGIDCDFFTPGERVPGEMDRTVLFVGHFIRDFELLRKLIINMASADRSVKFLATVWEEDRKYFEGLDNVTVKTKVSDEELREYYRRCPVLVQPMKDCTANNSMLEGMACGCPAVASEVGGVRDYVDDSCAILVPEPDPGVFAGRILDLLNDPVRLRLMSGNAREKALEFNWPKIAERLKEVYRLVRAM